MKKIEYLQGCEDLYEAFLETELTEVQTEWEKACNLKPDLKAFPSDVKTIVKASFEELTEWFFLYQDLKKKNSTIENVLKNKVTGKKTTLKIFDYNKYYPKIIKFFCINSDKMNFSSCFYCDIHPIGQYTKNKNNPRLTVDLDHFYPKDQCPILALSLKNFIPSCQICNSRVKGRTNFLEFYGIHKFLSKGQKCFLLSLSPSSDSYDFYNNANILVYPKENFLRKASFLENLGEYEIHFLCNDTYEKEVKAFKLEERYSSITILSQALSILDLKRKFPLKKIQEIKKYLSIGGELVTEEQIEEIIFRKEYDKKNYGNLLKLKNDLLE